MHRAARAYTTGIAEAAALVLRAPVSFWGGIDVDSGRIIDRAHPDAGATVTGAVLVMPGARGSSSSSSVLAEMLRKDTAPAGIVLTVADPILPVGVVVAGMLYGKSCPIVVCEIDGIKTGDVLRVRAAAGGSAEVVILPGDQSVARSGGGADAWKSV